MNPIFVIRGRYVGETSYDTGEPNRLPDGVGYVPAHGLAGITRDVRGAQTFEAEADAWAFLWTIKEWWGTDEQGHPDYWVEPLLDKASETM